MKLNKPLVATLGTKTATIYVELDSFRLELEFKVEDNKSTHNFTDEDTMFAYLSKFDFTPEQFTLNPF